MKYKLIIISILSVLFVSCVKDPKALVTIDDSGDGEVTSLVEFPVNSQGVTVLGNIQNSDFFEISIPAQKMYNPDVINNGWFYFNQTSEFELPETVNVIDGEAGNNLLVVAIKRKESDGLPSHLQCAYVGNGDHTQSYEFEYCIEGSVFLTEDNYKSVKEMAEVVLDKNMRTGTLIRMDRTDKIIVQVMNGNHEQNQATNVEFKVSAQKI